MKIINATQITSLETMKPYSILMFGRWIKIESNHDVTKWLRIRDKQLNKREVKNHEPNKLD
jgi:hypothetical protein